ncbi:MAG: ice-binding family protein [Planctomycetota bacterium]|nr:ice-binding family protein [Planctomycetota bacterium]
MNRKCLILAAIVALPLLAASQSYASPINLGTAGNFVILGKSGISTSGGSAVGDIGVSPIAATAITGFSLTLAPGGTFSTSALVTGKVYAADYSPPTPTYMTAAISAMEAAYTVAAGLGPVTIAEMGSGNIGGLTITPGIYKWTTGVIIPTDVTLSGNANDTWVFQITQTLDISSGKKVILSGGALADNIIWQVAGQTTLGTTSQFKGTILDQAAIVINTGAALDGRALSQTAVTLNGSVTPEPCTLLLIGSGLAGLFAARRRSRCAA